ncbi:MAG: tetratricopeptide repeat protein, partial [Bacteroidota bacterium]
MKLFDALPEENIRITKRKISTFHGLAQIWMSKQQLTKANQQIEKALQLQQKLSWRTPTSYQIQGEIATQAGQIDKAVRLLTKALTLALQPEHKMGAPSKARILIRLAQAQSLQKQHKKALESYNQALTYLRPGYVPLTTGIPPVDQLLDKPRALEVLNGKASTYWQLYLQSEDRQMLQSAQEYYLAATNLVKDIRQGYLTVDAKNTLASKSVSIYEGALLATWALYRQTDNQDHLRTAFQLAESNKALLLLEALNEQNARGFAGIPDSLLTCQKDLRIDLAYYQRKLLETQIRKPSKTKAIKSYESLIFELNKQLEELTDRFGQDYPRYQQLRSNTQPVALQQLQTVLQTKDERLLEYFYGDSLLFVFVVGPNAIEMYKLTNEGLSDKIDQFRQSLTAPASRQLNEQDFAAFTKQSHELYQLLVEKGLPELPDADGQIVIVPDHQLNYLPFGLLLVQPADPNQPTFKASAIDYLLNHCALSYEYSATLYCLSRNRVQPQHQASILGFAPDFEGPQLAQTVRDCNNVPLNQLNCNHQEVSQIAELLKGRPLLGGEANKQNFAAA